MKRFYSILLAGIFGGVIGAGVIKWTATNNFTPEEMSYAKQVHAPTNQAPNAYPFNFTDASKRATPSVVHIYAEESDQLAYRRQEERRSDRRNRRMPFEDFFGFDDFGLDDFFGRNFYQPRQGSGSGVIISNDGYIVTNNHVVGFADAIRVTLNDGREYAATKVGTDSSTDLAVIKIEADNLPTLSYADSDDVHVGEWVLAVGNPFSYLTSTVTAGIISAKGRDLDIIAGEKSIEEFIQTDAAVNPGNSGGALVDAQGRLIGINTAIATPTGVFAGYSFAIPINLVRKVVKEIRENGDIERVNLGIAGFNLNKEIANELNLDVEEGAYVEQVLNGSSALYAGVLPGDIVRSVNGEAVSSYEDIKEVIKFTKVGDTIQLSVLRNGRIQTIPVRLRKGI